MKEIVEFKGYSITEDGRVWSHKRNKFLSTRVEKNTGYTQITFNLSTDKRVTRNIHRLLAIAYIDNPENKSDVNHIDGNKLNNKLSNLEWVTRSENLKHAYALGLQPSKKGRVYGSYNKGKL